MIDIFTVDGLKNELLQTSLWCKQQDREAWRSRGYRTESLNCGSIYGPTGEIANFDESVAASTVNCVIRKRKQELGESAASTNFAINRPSAGSLLRHNLGDSTLTETAMNLTHGFFDSADVPPYDLWLAYIHDTQYAVRSMTAPGKEWFGRDKPSELTNYLLAWVPEFLKDCVENAIKASMEENIFWLGDCDTELVRKLRSDDSCQRYLASVSF